MCCDFQDSRNVVFLHALGAGATSCVVDRKTPLLSGSNKDLHGSTSCQKTLVRVPSCTQRRAHHLYLGTSTLLVCDCPVWATGTASGKCAQVHLRARTACLA